MRLPLRWQGTKRARRHHRPARAEELVAGPLRTTTAFAVLVAVFVAAVIAAAGLFPRVARASGRSSACCGRRGSHTITAFTRSVAVITSSIVGAVATAIVTTAVATTTTTTAATTSPDDAVTGGTNALRRSVKTACEAPQ